MTEHWSTLQRQLSAALLDRHAPNAALLAQFSIPPTAAGEHRLAIYRNNILHSLSNTLRARYPVVEQLLGDDSFRYFALDFCRQQPPTSPVLDHWGRAFADHLAAQSELIDLPYLRDVARLEWHHHCSQCAADAPHLAPHTLAAAELDVERLVLHCHPSVHFMTSRWPVVDIWRQNQPGADDQMLDLDRQPPHHYALSHCHHGDTIVQTLGATAFALLTQLYTDGCVQRAWTALSTRANDAVDNDAFSSDLATLLSLGAFSHYTLTTEITEEPSP